MWFIKFTGLTIIAVFLLVINFTGAPLNIVFKLGATLYTEAKSVVIQGIQYIKVLSSMFGQCKSAGKLVPFHAILSCYLYHALGFAKKVDKEACEIYNEHAPRG
jgi:hypothetical protein